MKEIIGAILMFFLVMGPTLFGWPIALVGGIVMVLKEIIAQIGF